MLKKAILFCLVLLVMAFMVLISQINQTNIGNTKVLLIGIDAFTWKILNPLIETGKLPNIKRLIDDGVYGKLESIEPMVSPALWTTIATGKVFEKHGINSFAETPPGFSDPIPVTSNLRKCKAIWNILTENGRKSIIIDYYVAYPPEKINGIMVSRLNYFPERAKYRKDLQRKQKFPCMTFPSSVEKKVNRIISNLDLFEGLDSPVSAFNDLKILESVSLNFVNNRWDFFALYTPVIDGTGHHHWRHMEPEKFRDPRWEVTEEGIKKYGNLIKDLYLEVDSFIGQLLTSIGKDTITIIVSDHGMKATLEFDSKNPYDSGEHDLYDGVIVMSGKGIKKGFWLTNASVLDIAPTILYLFNLPIARDMDGKVLTEAIETSFLEKKAIRYIDTYDTFKDQKKENIPISSPFDKEIINRLKSLGYLQ